MNKKCIAALGSVTTAMKCEKLLAERNINTKIIKIDPELTEKGCAYGVEIPCSRVNSAEKILANTNLDFKLLTI